MKIKNALDMDLRNLLRAEMQTLQKYEEMFDDLTAAEKDELREWMVNGNSVNSNPYLIYGENGCLMDLIEATRVDEDLAANAELYQWMDEKDGDNERLQDTDMPF